MSALACSLHFVLTSSCNSIYVHTIYIYIYTHTYIHEHTYIHTCIHTQTYIHTGICTHQGRIIRFLFLLIWLSFFIHGYVELHSSVFSICYLWDNSYIVTTVECFYKATIYTCCCVMVRVFLVSFRLILMLKETMAYCTIKHLRTTL